jgi:prepilin-type N-terminal cleavage/methylation domain-containing protein
VTGHTIARLAFMTARAHRSHTLRTLRRWRLSDGVSLLELLCAVVVVGVLATATYTGVRSYDRSRRAARVANMLQWEITVARGYAIRSGRQMSLIVDEQARSVALRDGEVTWRRLSLGDGTPMRVDRITLDLPGDSLVFSPRGLCINCSASRLTDLSVGSGGRVATIQIGRLGQPELHSADASPSN